MINLKNIKQTENETAWSAGKYFHPCTISFVLSRTIWLSPYRECSFSLLSQQIHRNLLSCKYNVYRTGWGIIWLYIYVSLNWIPCIQQRYSQQMKRTNLWKNRSVSRLRLWIFNYELMCFKFSINISIDYTVYIKIDTNKFVSNYLLRNSFINYTCMFQTIGSIFYNKLNKMAIVCKLFCSKDNKYHQLINKYYSYHHEYEYCRKIYFIDYM